MKELTRAEILANRQKVITFLKQPKRIKTTGKLDRGNGARCCLGHICYALKMPRKLVSGLYAYGIREQTSFAPEETKQALGLFTSCGHRGDSCKINIPNVSFDYISLSTINDNTKATPQQIGAYLESVIEGGSDTPWKALTDYPETV